MLLKVSEIDDLFVDAYLTDQSSNLLFLSTYARDTVMQEFLAKLTLNRSEGGLSDFHILNKGRENYVKISDFNTLSKHTGRLPKNIFGNVTNVWLYDDIVQKADLSNKRAVLLYKAQDKEALVQQKLWTLVCSACHLPLLDHWQDTLLSEFEEQGWLEKLDGVGVSGILIDLSSNNVESQISHMIRNGRLGLSVDSQDKKLSSCKQTKAEDNIFGEVIYAYTRENAINDGYLIDVSTVAREAGIKWPTALTYAAWLDCVFWESEDNKQTYQDESGRLWDVLYMARRALKSAASGSTSTVYELFRVPRDRVSHEAQLTKLKLVSGPGDHGEPVITIMLPDES